MIEAFYLAIKRVKFLQSEKIIVMFFKSVNHYSQLFNRLNRRKKKSEEELSRSVILQENQAEREDCSVEDFGECIVNAMKTEGLRNCKVIFYCAMEDSIDRFRDFFGLEQVNRRIYGK